MGSRLHDSKSDEKAGVTQMCRCDKFRQFPYTVHSPCDRTFPPSIVTADSVSIVSIAFVVATERTERCVVVNGTLWGEEMDPCVHDSMAGQQEGRSLFKAKVHRKYGSMYHTVADLRYSDERCL